MQEKELSNVIKNIKMPGQVARELTENLSRSKPTGSRLLLRSRLAAAALIAVLAVSIGTTSHAAYSLYQTKNVNVFFVEGISAEQMADIKEALEDMPGISAVRFISADEAWQTFQQEFLPDLGAQFPENPLKDSYNYQVTIRLDADTQEVRRQIEQLDGVRLVSDLRETREP